MEGNGGKTGTQVPGSGTHLDGVVVQTRTKVKNINSSQVLL
jgi:hypothetical protein